jgi:hypothetical protein
MQRNRGGLLMPEGFTFEQRTGAFLARSASFEVALGLGSGVRRESPLWYFLFIFLLR